MNKVTSDFSDYKLQELLMQCICTDCTNHHHISRLLAQTVNNILYTLNSVLITRSGLWLNALGLGLGLGR